MRSVYRYIISLVLLCAVMVISPIKAEAFSDTDQHWARMDIEHLQSREIVSGYPDYTYRPEAFISRQEFIVLLLRAMNKQSEADVLQKGTAYFADGDTWAKGYIELAHELNLVQGDGQNIFSPARSISREEAVTILIKCLGYDANSGAAAGFQDDAEISAWAYPSISIAKEQGLINGFPDNTFRPRSNLTRAQVVIMLESLLSNLGREYQIYGTVTHIDIPLHKALVTVAGRQEAFELAPNIAVWSKDKHTPETEIILPVTAYLDLNPNGKLAYILIINQSEKVPSTKLNYSALPEPYKSAEDNSGLVSLAAGEDTEETLQVNDREAAASLLATREAMGVREFINRTGATGKGQLVAVIDSGIDPGHPDLQTTSQGYKKMLDFIDLTDEGTVTLSKAKANNGSIILGDARVDVSSLSGSEGLFKYGYFNLEFLPENSGLAARKLLVVLAASTPNSGFNVVYIDTDGDGQIKDETAVWKYSKSQQFISIRGDKGHNLNLVVSEISDNGSYIKFGFDGLGHGTEVAGIIAAQGKVNGVAPDAQLLVLKVMDRAGTASLQKLESALSLAADRGAGVAVVSLGQYHMTAEQQESLSQTAAFIRKTKGMIICMAAGNSGPGLGTVADSTGLNDIITVGAYATPEMWATDYGWQVPNPTLWYFSSTGPAYNAGTAPLLLAPGSAICTYPLWADNQYHKEKGTSVAAPHLAAAAALLLDANEHRLYSSDKSAVYQTLLAGAQPIKGLQAVEQGFGAVNLPRAWQELQLRKGKTAPVEARQYNPGDVLISGLYARGLTPAALPIHIKNTGDTNTTLSLGGLADWINPGQFNLQVPAHSERIVEVNYAQLDEPDLYSSFLVADDYNSSGLDLAMLQTVVVPRDMSKLKSIELSNQLGPGELKHYFFRVPNGADRIDFKLLVKEGKGLARIFVISPAGSQEASLYAGIGNGESIVSSSLSYSYPPSGIWEVVVYSSVSLSDYQLQSTDYSLQAILEGGTKDSTVQADDRYFISTVATTITPGNQMKLTLFFWNRASKLPASGVVSIDDRLYEIENGMVTLSYIPHQDTITLNIAW